jgi:hypothetical protein
MINLITEEIDLGNYVSIKDLKKKISELEIKYPDAKSITFVAEKTYFYGDESISLIVSIHRPETDEEARKRILKSEEDRLKKEESQKELYLKLKAQFGDK